MPAQVSFNVTQVPGNVCRYRFQFTITVTGKPITTGSISFELLPGVGSPINVSSNPDPKLPPQLTLTADLGADGKLYTWSLPRLDPGDDPLTLSFDADFIGEARQPIMNSYAWSVYYTNGDYDPPTTVPYAVTAAVKCPTTPVDTPPTLTVSVAPIADNPCRYRFVFTLTRGTKNIKAYSLRLLLDDGFGTLLDVNPPNNQNPALLPQLESGIAVPGADSYIWAIPGISAPETTKTVSFEAVYTGDAGVPIFFTQQIPWSVVLLSGESAEDPVIETPVINTTVTTTKCPVTPPVDVACCEACGTETASDVTIDSCDDVGVANATTVVTPRGRRLDVNLNLPAVCDMKDIVVGVYVTEVAADGTETPYAHKVIRRSATTATGTCKDDRDCNCVQFFIEDTAACDTARTFRVRTKAHYLDTEISTVQTCPCDCPVG